MGRDGGRRNSQGSGQKIGRENSRGNRQESGQEDSQAFLGTMPVGKLLWKMTVPSVIGVMAYNLYNVFDTLFISFGAGMEAVGGVAVSFPLFLFLSALSTTLGSGGASVMSRALGEQNQEKASKAAAQTFGLFYMAAVCVTIVGLLFLDELLYMMGITEALLPYARDYTRIILLGAVTSTGFSNLIRAQGDGKYAMYIWVIPVTMNVILDVWFIFGLRLGVRGAALATVLSQVVSMGMSVYFFYFSGRSRLRLSWRHFCPDLLLLREIILIGLPSLLQMSGLGISIIMTNRFLKMYGELPIAVYGIVSKINAFLLFPITGLTQGLQPIIGYNQGARKKERVRHALVAASLVAVGYGVTAFLFTLLCSGQIVRLFMPDVSAVELGGHVLIIVNVGLAFSGLQGVRTTYFQAIGKKYQALWCVLCNYIIFLVPLLGVLNHFFGLEGIWYAYPLSATMTAGMGMILGGRKN